MMLRRDGYGVCLHCDMLCDTCALAKSLLRVRYPYAIFFSRKQPACSLFLSQKQRFHIYNLQDLVQIGAFLLIQQAGLVRSQQLLIPLNILTTCQ